MQGIANNTISNHTFKSLLLQEKEEVKGKGFVGFFNISPPPYFRIFNIVLRIASIVQIVLLKSICLACCLMCRSDMSD